MLDRLLGHWKTSAAGVGLSGVGLYVLQSWDCKVPQGMVGWLAWASVAAPAILGILAKDK
jgi:hypothetical protein